MTPEKILSSLKPHFLLGRRDGVNVWSVHHQGSVAHWTKMSLEKRDSRPRCQTGGKNTALDAVATGMKMQDEGEKGREMDGETR